jgi:pimeloyl-ACP methyl ester carboxylesterase
MEFHKFEERIVAEKHNVFFGKIKTKLFAEKIDAVDEYGVSNREIEIFYMVRRSLVEEAPYLIFFNGGPGIGFSEQFFEHNGYNDFMTDYNIVFMDQRGTGFSDRPLNNLYEYRYFSSRYICHDAEEIRKKLLTGNKKWIVFGQSFGGHLVRKYLELYANSALVGISHGYGECSSITMKRNIEKVLFKQVDDYFLKYKRKS